MGSIIEKIRKRRQDRAAEIIRLSSDLDAMKAQRQQMETEINAAIDGDNTAQAERLVNQQHDLDVKIEVLERTISRKSAKDLDRAEIIEASNKETADYQKKIDQAQTAVMTAKKAYLSKLIDLAALVNEAWDARTNFCRLLEEIDDPTSYNVQTKEFDGVHASVRWDKLDEDLLKEINPAAVSILSEAARNKTNIYAGRDSTPKDPGVLVSKYR